MSGPEDAKRKPEDANDLLKQLGPDALRRNFDRASEAASPSNSPTAKKLTPTPWTLPDSSTIPLRPWVYGRLLMRGTLTVTIAPGGMGKSILAITEAVAMAAQRNLLDETLPQGGLRVWYVNCEDPNADANPELTRRATAACKHYGISDDDLGGSLFLDSAVFTPIKLATLDNNQKGYILDEAEFGRLEGEIRQNMIDVVILDPFVSIHDLNENDNPMIDRLAKRLVRLASITGCAIHLIHHTRKSNGAENDADSSRGASSLVAAARIVRVLNPMTDKEAAKAELPKGSHRRYFRTSIDKQNLAPPQTERNWHELVSVDLGNGTPPLQLNSESVGVPQKWSWPDQQVAVEAKTILRIQEAVHGMNYPTNHTAAEWVGWQIAAITGHTMNRQGKKAPEGHHPVLRIQAMLLQDGWLTIEEVPDARRGGTRKVIAVGNWAEDAKENEDGAS